MTRTTKEQRKAIARLWARLETRPPYRAFRALAQGTIGCDGAVVLPYAGMWVAIEPDGYAHS